MPRYIDAKYMFKCETCRHYRENKCNTFCDSGESYSPNMSKIPTADVAEVKHGEWINKNGIYVCSECDSTCPYDVVADNIEYWECDYCPKCGQKMDGERKEK